MNHRSACRNRRGFVGIRTWQADPVSDLQLGPAKAPNSAKLGRSSVQYIDGSGQPAMELRYVFIELAASYWSGTPTNDFFVNLLANEHRVATSADGTFEGCDSASGKVRWTATEVDLVFGWNSELRVLAEVYACDDGREAFRARLRRHLEQGDEPRPLRSDLTAAWTAWCTTAGFRSALRTECRVRPSPRPTSRSDLPPRCVLL